MSRQAYKKHGAEEMNGIEKPREGMSCIGRGTNEPLKYIHPN